MITVFTLHISLYNFFKKTTQFFKKRIFFAQNQLMTLFIIEHFTLFMQKNSLPNQKLSLDISLITLISSL